MNTTYAGVEQEFVDKLRVTTDQCNNEQILQMNLLSKILKLNPDLRPSATQILLHILFWSNKRSLEFVLEIRKKFDILDPKFASKIKSKNEHQKVQLNTPIVQQLKVALDKDVSVVNNDWIGKLDKPLADEFKKGYDKAQLSDLLRAMRNKVII